MGSLTVVGSETIWAASAEQPTTADFALIALVGAPAGFLVAGLLVGPAEDAGLAVVADFPTEDEMMRVFFRPVAGGPPKVGGMRLVPPSPADDDDGPAPEEVPVATLWLAAVDNGPKGGRRLVPAVSGLLEDPPAAAAAASVV